MKRYSFIKTYEIEAPFECIETGGKGSQAIIRRAKVNELLKRGRKSEEESSRIKRLPCWTHIMDYLSSLFKLIEEQNLESFGETERIQAQLNEDLTHSVS